MKMMRLAALLLCLLLAFSACSANGSKSEASAPAPVTREQTEPAPEKTEPAPVETESAPVETEPASVETEPASVETEPAPVETEPAKELQAGSVEGSVYTNEYLDLRCEAPTGWVFYTDEQIALVNNLSSEIVKDGDVAEAVKKAGQYMDMYMSNTLTNENVNLNILPMSPQMTLFSDEELFTLMRESFEAQLNAAGFEVSGVEQIDLEFRGEAVKCIKIELNVSGIDLEEYQIWIRPGGDYYGVLNLTVRAGGDYREILDCFTKLN